jgi:hypothetical protein
VLVALLGATKALLAMVFAVFCLSPASLFVGVAVSVLAQRVHCVTTFVLQQSGHATRFDHHTSSPVTCMSLHSNQPSSALGFRASASRRTSGSFGRCLLRLVRRQTVQHSRCKRVRASVAVQIHQWFAQLELLPTKESRQ